MEYVVKVKDVKPVIPGGHTGTKNRPLINEKCGINDFILNYGEVEPAGGAVPHTHPYDQACFETDLLGGGCVDVAFTDVVVLCARIPFECACAIHVL